MAPVVALTATIRSGLACPLVTNRLPAGTAVPPSEAIPVCKNWMPPKKLVLPNAAVKLKLPRLCPVVKSIRWTCAGVSFVTIQVWLVVRSIAMSRKKPLPTLRLLSAIGALVPPAVVTVKVPSPWMGSATFTRVAPEKESGPTPCAVSVRLPPAH